MENSADLVDHIKGFLEKEEGQCLYELALDASASGPCLEIGSYCGKSTVYLGRACQQNNSILFSIDHHRGSEEQQPGEAYFDPELFDPFSGQVDTFNAFRKTLAMAELEDTVVPMVCRSDVAARLWATPLSLVFIDASHAYEAVWMDYQLWTPHVLPGGYLVFHDLFEEPQLGGQAPYQVFQFALKSGCYVNLARVNTLGVLQRKLS